MEYRDAAEGTMQEHEDGSGAFVWRAVAAALHHETHGLCFIARSVKFPVEVEPEVL